ncbi:MAG: AAA family ATPase [Allorhizobium sp.]
MDIHDQSATIAFLKNAENYGFSGPVKVIETHISLIFLIDGLAFKLKRAVKLPYVDFSTVALRLDFCRREFELNSRSAPDLYLGIRKITRAADGQLALEGPGEVIDAVVEMRRFSQHNLFDRLAGEGRLTPALMEQTALMITEFHDSAPVRHTGGGSANMAGVLDINESGFATSHVFAPDAVRTLTTAFKAAWATHIEAMDTREVAGKIRLCHGDLHLRNIFLSDTGPRLFDCIDFNDQIATVDVLYDLSFLLMDLWHRDFPAYANIVMNRYLDVTGDDSGYPLLPFFMAVRAAVRAHVTATQIEEAGDPDGAMTANATAYFDLAGTLLRPGMPQLIVIGGLSGSGKSTLAEALAPGLGLPPGARILESDRIRKAMFSLKPAERLPEEAYLPEISQKVYTTLQTKARSILAGGGTVIVNGVFDREDLRAEIAAVASALGVAFVGIWLEADAQTLMARVRSRPKGTSDATTDVLEQQLSRDIGDIVWHRIDAAEPLDAVASAARMLLTR